MARWALQLGQAAQHWDEEQLFPPPHTLLPINSQQGSHGGSGSAQCQWTGCSLTWQGWHFPPSHLQPVFAHWPGAVPSCPPEPPFHPLQPQGLPSFASPWLCHGLAPSPLSIPGVLLAHRRVGLNEAVLQVTGLLPLALAAQVVQLAQRVTQNIGEGTHPARGT